jgi:protein TonB
MSNASISPRQLERWQLEPVKTALAPVIPLKPFDDELALAGGGAAWAGGAGLGTFKPDLEGRDRKAIDALVVIALTIFLHATVIERFKHPPPELPAPPKETKIEISLLKPPPPPPPPPPVVQPKPQPAPIKDAIPPKPKPKPKKQPPPVVQQQPVPTPAPVVSDAPPAPVQAAPAPPPPKPVEKVVSVSSADYLRRPEPEYPQDAQDRGWEGKVLVKARILPSGKPDGVQVQKSSGHASLDAAAVRAVKASLFKPNMRGDTATTVVALIPIVFQL